MPHKHRRYMGPGGSRFQHPDDRPRLMLLSPISLLDFSEYVLDRGTRIFAIIAGNDSLLAAAAELARVVKPDSTVLCVSKVVVCRT